MIINVPKPFRITNIREENDYTKTFMLAGEMTAVPGQFVMVWQPDAEERPFSLVDIKPLCLTIAAVGAFTRTLHNLQIGDNLWLRGPFGQGYQWQIGANRKDQILLVGESYFVGSLLFLARQLRLENYSMAVALYAENRGDLTHLGSFKALGLAPIVITKDVSAEGEIVDGLEIIRGELPTAVATVYGSGSSSFLAVVARYCSLSGIEYQLAWKAEMKCAIGVCGTCEIKNGWLTCVDGPVLSFNPLSLPRVLPSK